MSLVTKLFVLGQTRGHCARNSRSRATSPHFTLSLFIGGSGWVRLYGCETIKLSCCACCGIAEIDDIQLVPCDDCDLVKYCGDDCQELHRSEHAGKCKMRAAELRAELLFKQPESTHMGDCPICSLPLPLDGSKSGM